MTTTRISGKDSYQTALRKARFGHRMWIVWTGRDGVRYADRATPETIKEALLAHGTQDRRWTLICEDGAPLKGFWFLGINVIKQLRMGWR
jgi:hypothetical protein